MNRWGDSATLPDATVPLTLPLWPCSFCVADAAAIPNPRSGGAVTFDGKPLERGTIAFRPSDGKGPTACGLIANGRYSCRLAPGKWRVEIEGYKQVGQQWADENDPTSPLVPKLEAIVPQIQFPHDVDALDVNNGTRVADLR